MSDEEEELNEDVAMNKDEEEDEEEDEDEDDLLDKTGPDSFSILDSLHMSTLQPSTLEDRPKIDFGSTSSSTFPEPTTSGDSLGGALSLAQAKSLQVPEASTSSIGMNGEEERQRFLLELEFVQQLANPQYLHFLALNRYFQDKSFVNYLKYLQYWKKQEYAKFLVYPHCLFFLDLLQHEQFRNELVQPNYMDFLFRQQYYHWRHYKENRSKEAMQQEQSETSLAGPSTSGAPLPQPTQPTMEQSIVHTQTT
jgi:mediator of RNA polymerase II transcription subunit 31